MCPDQRPVKDMRAMKDMTPVEDAGVAGTLGFHIDSKSLVWKETHWRTAGYREYPWSMLAMQVQPLFSPFFLCL
jgi:hypothetical protein